MRWVYRIARITLPFTTTASLSRLGVFPKAYDALFAVPPPGTRRSYRRLAARQTPPLCTGRSLVRLALPALSITSHGWRSWYRGTHHHVFVYGATRERNVSYIRSRSRAAAHRFFAAISAKALTKTRRLDLPVVTSCLHEARCHGYTPLYRRCDGYRRQAARCVRQCRSASFGDASIVRVKNARHDRYVVLSVDSG